MTDPIASTASPPPPCPHGLRPGTVVCLHCRLEARQAAQRRRYKVAARIGLALMGGGVAMALVIGGLNALAPEARSLGRSVSQAVQKAVPQGKIALSRTEAPTLEPIIAEGRVDLGDSVIAERAGNAVTVTFDTDALRTRYDWKFEGVVRATLPAVFGADARTALDSIPSGTFVRGGDLMRDLPHRGIPLSLSGKERTLRVWPVTRMGRDGPLVVGYRVAVVK